MRDFSPLKSDFEGPGASSLGEMRLKLMIFLGDANS